MEESPSIVPINNPVWTATREPAPVDGSTIMSNHTEETPNTTNNGSAANPLNISTSRYVWQIPLDGNKILFSNCGLRIRMVMCGIGTNGAIYDLPSQSPEVQPSPSNTAWPATAESSGPNFTDCYYGVDPFMCYALFKEATLKLNGRTVYSSSPEQVVSDAIVRIMSKYTAESINSTLSDALFTPMGDTSYAVARALTAAQSATAATTVTDPYVSLGNGSALSRPVIAFDPVTPACGSIVDSNPYANDPVFIERTKQWCSPIGSANRTIEKILPLSTLFPDLGNVVFNNVKNLGVELMFSGKGRDLLIPLSTAPVHAAIDSSKGGYGVSVVEMSIVTNVLTSDPATSIDNAVSAIKMGDSDLIPMLYQQTYPIPFNPNSDHFLTGISNMQSLAAWMPTDGLTNDDWATAASTINGNADATALASLRGQMKNTFSQMVPFSSFQSNFARVLAVGDTAAAAKKKALQGRIFAKDALDCINPATSTQMMFAGKSYPIVPMALAYPCAGGAAGYKAMMGQSHFISGVNQDRIISNVYGMSNATAVYQKTMPMLYFRPTNMLPILGPSDTTMKIRINGGTKNNSQQNAVFVVTMYRLYKVSPGGQVEQVK